MRHWLAVVLILSMVGHVPAVALAPAPRLSRTARAADIAAEVARAIRESGIPEAAVAVSVRDVASGKIIADHHGGSPRIPASNMKVLTTGAALHVLGPDWRFRTRLLRTGDRLTVVGDGDPGLGDPEFLDRLVHTTAAGERRRGMNTEQLVDTWVDAVRRSGTTAVAEVVVDDRIFDREYAHPRWPADQLDNSYCARVAGLNFHENLLDATLRKDGGRPMATATAPASPWITFDPGKATAVGGAKQKQTVAILRTDSPWSFRLSGNLKVVPDQPVRICLADPPQFFARYVAERLTAAGVAVGAWRTASAGDGAATGDPVGPSIETPLVEIVRRCNEESHNMYAEALLKRIGAARSGAPGSWTTGAQALVAAVDERLGAGIAAKALVVSDGSGLSRDNRVAPGLVTAWLRSLATDDRLGQAFLEGMAVGGRTGTVRNRFKGLDPATTFVPCKTGYINGVSCLSGCVGDVGAPPRHAFSVMCNDLQGVPEGVGKAKALQDRIVMILAGSS